ncbi:hypothetical protein V6N11_001511 [Hibiscus sabdariffa]|uniref:Uncharacterized protein n=1 Tax=Hibiscus sabdariffa TaxID=183260 RepID=A0ABR2S071_9ROSI
MMKMKHGALSLCMLSRLVPSTPSSLLCGMVQLVRYNTRSVIRGKDRVDLLEQSELSPKERAQIWRLEMGPHLREGGNPCVVRIHLGSEDEPKNFIAHYTGCHVRTWKYQDKDVPPGNVVISEHVNLLVSSVKPTLFAFIIDAVNIGSTRPHASSALEETSLISSIVVNLPLSANLISFVALGFLLFVNSTNIVTNMLPSYACVDFTEEVFAGTNVVDSTIVHCALENASIGVAPSVILARLGPLNDESLETPNSEPLKALTPLTIFYPWKGNTDAKRWFHPEAASKRLSNLFSSSIFLLSL